MYYILVNPSLGRVPGPAASVLPAQTPPEIPQAGCSDLGAWVAQASAYWSLIYTLRRMCERLDGPDPGGNGDGELGLPGAGAAVGVSDAAPLTLTAPGLTHSNPATDARVHWAARPRRRTLASTYAQLVASAAKRRAVAVSACDSEPRDMYVRAGAVRQRPASVRARPRGWWRR